jgi:hypothetical protein
MEHKMYLEKEVKTSITIIEEDNSVKIELFNYSECLSVSLNKKELHKLIGTLLHVQQKMNK